MEREVPAGRHAAQRSVPRHIVRAVVDRELSVGQCKSSDLASFDVDRNNHNNDSDNNNNNDNGNDNDVRQSTTSHVQRSMAVSAKELSTGRYPYEPLKLKNEFVDGASRAQLLMDRHIKAPVFGKFRSWSRARRYVIPGNRKPFGFLSPTNQQQGSRKATGPGPSGNPMVSP